MLDFAPVLEPCADEVQQCWRRLPEGGLLTPPRGQPWRAAYGDTLGGMAFDAIMMIHGWIHLQSRPQDFNLRLETIIDHMDHVCQLTGTARHLALGSDLDGGFGTEQMPIGLDSIADLQLLGGMLERRGYSAADIEGIFHGNALRFLTENLPR